MKSYSHYYLLLLLITLLPSCKKEEPGTIHIHGRITEFGTGEPVAGARIYLLCDNSVIFGPSGSSLADSLVTDSAGRFDHTFLDDSLCNNLILLPYKDGYWKGNIIAVTTNFPEQNIVLDPEAWVKFVTIPDGSGSSKHISIGGDFSFIVSTTTGETKIKYFVGLGNRPINIYWSYFSNPSLTYSDTLFLPGHDTTTYTIHY